MATRSNTRALPTVASRPSATEQGYGCDVEYWTNRQQIEKDVGRELQRLQPQRLQESRMMTGPPTYTAAVQAKLVTTLSKAHAIRDLRLKIALRSLGIRSPTPVPATTEVDGRPVHSVDMEKAKALSLYALRSGASLENLIELVRGQTEADQRPNKALSPERYTRLLKDYRHCERMINAAKQGIAPVWKPDGPAAGARAPNHASARRYANAVRGAIRGGQDGGQYLIVLQGLLEKWPHVTCSPFSAIEKKGEDPCAVCRLIHDLKCPLGDSTNAATDKEALPEMHYISVAILAQRIEWCRTTCPNDEVWMMSGDVKGAYRHLMVHAAHAHRLGAQWPLDGIAIIDMSAPFGWTASPAYYGMFGGAITWLVQRESPATMSGDVNDDNEAFFGYEWVDDHVMVEVDRGDRLHWANEALRLAMMAVLGPNAVNEKKFSQWSQHLRVLGLEFDTKAGTVSTPADKIAKAAERADAMCRAPYTSRQALRKVLGSLRHVCTCIPSARPFYQQLHLSATKAHPVGRVALTPAARNDLRWFQVILRHGRLRHVPTAQFARTVAPSTHIYMDASNDGLVVLDPAHMEYIQVRFDDEEREWIHACAARPDPMVANFNINVREHLCMGLAAALWGPRWGHKSNGSVDLVRCWSDNTAAVAWNNSKASRNAFGSEVNRFIGLHEALHGFSIEARHLPGDANRMADAGSRMWSEPAMHLVWTNLSHGWTQTSVPCELRKIYKTFSTNYCPQHWPSHPSATVGHAVGLAPGHRLVVRGMQRLSPAPQSKKPATAALLLTLRSQRDFRQAKDRVLWGAAVLGFFFLLRKSEYLSTNGRLAWYALRYADAWCKTHGDLVAASKDSAAAVEVTIRGSKTDQQGRATTLRLTATQGLLCPVQAVWELKRHGERLGLDKTSPLCSVSSSTTIDDKTMATAVKTAAAAHGRDPKLYGTHSMRSGGATALFAAGVDLLAIKKFGRWKSDCVDTYAVLTDACSEAMATQMARPRQQGATSRRSTKNGEPRAANHVGQLGADLHARSPRQRSRGGSPFQYKRHGCPHQ